MSEPIDQPVPADDKTTIQTSHGPLAVPNSLITIWNKHGWPEDDVVRRMVERLDVAASPDADR
jgi:hypothetical protein